MSAIRSWIRRRSRFRTVPGRLTFWHAGTLAISLGAFATFVLIVRASSLHREFDTDLSARAAALAAEFGPLIRPVDWARRADALAEAALLVNTTSQGMTGEAALDLDLDRLPRDALVNDAVYAPLETPLLAAARRRGNPAVDGLGMLLHQARPGFAAWFGVEPAVTPALRDAVLATLA